MSFQLVIAEKPSVAHISFHCTPFLIIIPHISST